MSQRGLDRGPPISDPFSFPISSRGKGLWPSLLQWWLLGAWPRPVCLLPKLQPWRGLHSLLQLLWGVSIIAKGACFPPPCFHPRPVFLTLPFLPLATRRESREFAQGDVCLPCHPQCQKIEGGLTCNGQVWVNTFFLRKQWGVEGGITFKLLLHLTTLHF